MNAATVMTLLLLAAPLTALAQSEPLDLKLKDPPTTLSGDPPGTYYGDHSGPATSDGKQPAQDDGKAHIHGSFTTGMGYSKGYGSSTYNAADINISKSFTSDEGRTSTVSMDIHVSQGDGPFGGYGPYGYGGYGGYRHSGSRSASGASFGWSRDDGAE